MNLYEILGRKEEEIARLRAQVQEFSQLLLKLRRGEMSVEQLDQFVTVVGEPQSNGVVPEEDSRGSNSQSDTRTAP